MPALSKPLRISAIVAVAVVAFLVVWLIVQANSESSPNAPQVASPDELQELASSSDRPVYWAGTLPGRELEVTRLETGSAYVRYLPEGTEPGDPRPDFLTIATYPQRDGFEAVSASARGRRSVKRELPDGGLAVYSRDRPTSVFFSYPRARYQVEVYDPSPGRALSLVTSGSVVPVR